MLPLRDGVGTLSKRGGETFGGKKTIKQSSTINDEIQVNAKYYNQIE